MNKIKYLIFSCVFFCLFTSTLADEARIDDSVFGSISNSIKIKHFEAEISKLENRTDLTYLTYYYKKSDDNSKLGAYFLQRISHRLDCVAMILLIDCDHVVPSDVSHCKSRDFPKIKLLVPPMFKFDQQTRKMNHHVEVEFSEEDVSEDTLYKFITKNVPSYSSKITNEHAQNFLNQPLFNKIILFTEKDKTPLIYKGLSSLFYDRILFGEVHSSEKEIIEKFNVMSFPTIVVVENPFLLKDTHKLHYYQGNVVASELAEFIEQFALREKNYVKRMTDMKAERSPFARLNSENYESFFDSEESENKSKIVYFTNGHFDVSKLPEDIKRFAAQSSGYFNFGIFDCKDVKKLCKSEFFVDVDKLPSLYVFNPKDQGLMMRNNRLLPTSYQKLLNYFVQRIESNITKISENEEVYDVISLDRENKKWPVIYFHKVRDYLVRMKLK